MEIGLGVIFLIWLYVGYRHWKEIRQNQKKLDEKILKHINKRMEGK